MTEHNKAQRIAVIGIDLAKRRFHLWGMDGLGRLVLQPTLVSLTLSRD